LFSSGFWTWGIVGDGDNLQFQNDATIRLTINSSGYVGIGVAPTARNNTRLQIVDGIGFPATQVASSDANTLDDYEEGISAAVTVTCSGSGTVTLEVANDTLGYEKIGAFCHFHGRLAVASVSSPVGYFTIPLPFTAASTAEDSDYSIASVSVAVTNAANMSDFVGVVAGGGTSLLVYLGDGVTFQSDSANELKAGSLIYVSLSYRTA
jgi:hypothetical protein